MLGNILLVISALFLWGLVSVSSSPMPGGDRGVGYAFALLISGAGFLVFTGFLAWHLGWNQCFDWISAKGQQNWLVFFGWLAFVGATFASAAFLSEWHEGELPQFLRWLAKSYASVWLPVLVLVPSVALLHTERAVGTAPDWVKIPLMAGMAVSAVICACIAFGWFRASAQQAAARTEAERQRQDGLHQQHLDFIAAQKITDPILNILSLSGRFHDDDVRNAAIEKIKAHPDWEDELIRLLSDTDWQSEVFQFIDGNRVEHPERFVEPLNNGIRRMAASVRRDIKGSNNLQDWHFEHLSLPRLFRAIEEQFLVPGADYRPAVLELRRAFDTPKPERFANVRFTSVPLIDEWLKAHR